MRLYELSTMERGWFVGDFKPVALRTEACEVAVKRYKAGTQDEPHIHRIATEVTLLLSGEARVNGVKVKKGTIFVIDAGEATTFEALSDTETVVVKLPSISNDKYPVEK